MRLKKFKGATCAYSFLKTTTSTGSKMMEEL